MPHPRTELRDYVCNVLAEFGARDVEFEHGGKHPKVRFTCPRGDQQIRTFSSTPSDRRTRLNLRTELKHACGMVESDSA